eukprot:XP_011673850.1 PREDICTED: E-selectin-like [Strongylocentrotus purpuratus]
MPRIGSQSIPAGCDRKLVVGALKPGTSHFGRRSPGKRSRKQAPRFGFRGLPQIRQLQACASTHNLPDSFNINSEITCTAPLVDEHVNSSCSPNTSVSYNERCNFSCPTGYNLTGPSFVTCTGSGNFSEPFPECVEITCTAPLVDEHVNSSCSPNTSVSYNERCNFSCPTGYNLTGPSFVTCTGLGNFSEPFPECVEITCTAPLVDEHVNSSCSPNTSVSYNERCNFSCPTGYNLTGPSFVTCTGSGNFSEPFPECVEITCTATSVGENVSSSCSPGDSVSYNERCNFSCPTGYNLIGSSSVNCTSSGNFSEPFPECEAYRRGFRLPIDPAGQDSWTQPNYGALASLYLIVNYST